MRQRQRVLASCEARIGLQALRFQGAQLSHALAELGRSHVHLPAVAAEQGARPRPPHQVQRVAVAFEQLQRRHAQHHIADPIAQANDQVLRWSVQGGLSGGR